MRKSICGRFFLPRNAKEKILRFSNEKEGATFYVHVFKDGSAICVPDKYYKLLYFGKSGREGWCRSIIYSEVQRDMRRNMFVIHSPDLSLSEIDSIFISRRGMRMPTNFVGIRYDKL